MFDDEPISVYVPSSEGVYDGDAHYAWFVGGHDLPILGRNTPFPVGISEHHMKLTSSIFCGPDRNPPAVKLVTLGSSNTHPTEDWMPLDPESAITLGMALVRAGLRAKRARGEQQP